MAERKGFANKEPAEVKTGAEKGMDRAPEGKGAAKHEGGKKHHRGGSRRHSRK